MPQNHADPLARRSGAGGAPLDAPAGAAGAGDGHVGRLAAVMTSALSSEEVSDWRCSAFSRAADIDPIGTAGSYRGYILVEWPLPWPSDLGEIPELAAVATAANDAGLRLQGLVASPGELRTVICYVAPPGPFRAFIRDESVVSPAEVVEAALELIAASAERSAAAVPEHPEPAIRDVLVCTHGSRDRCCGSLGTSLALEMAALRAAGQIRAEGGDGAQLGAVRVWRTSHTGGHRFAPNAIVLPEGTVWGLLDAEHLTAVLQRTEPAGKYLGGYRGCSGLGAPQLQMLERAALAEFSWAVLDARRSGQVQELPGRPLDRSGGGDPASASSAAPRSDWSEVTLELSWDDGSSAALSGEVGVGRRVPIPDCGIPVTQSSKVEKELALRDLRRLA